MDEPETVICEDCGCEFKLNEENRWAPYPMCDACYDEWLMQQSLQKTEE